MSLRGVLNPFYAGVFLVSGCLMGLQVIQARIFSVTTWYHLAFLVVSVAMFGMTAGAMEVHRGNKDRQRTEYAAMMSQASMKFSFYMLVALAAQLLVPIIYGHVAGTLVTLPLISLVTVIPYYFAGIILSLALTRAPYPVGRTYGVDLVGAAAGCMGALALMNTFDAPTGVMIVAVVATGASMLFARDASLAVDRRVWLLAAGIAVAVVANVALPRPFIYPYFVKTRPLPQETLTFDEWNSISRVVVSRAVTGTPYLWGASPNLPESTRADYHLLTIDGDAATPITKFDGKDWGALSYLEYDVTTIAYAAAGKERAAIIGMGGGRDILTARYFGIRDINALDINNLQIELLSQREPFRTYAGIDGLPGVSMIHAEARSWFARQEDKFDIIQMSLIDTWAATGAGAYALSENGLYTVESFRTFIEDLKPGGVLTVSRWYADDAQNEMQRLLSLAMAAQFAAGADDPARHIYVARAGNIATLVLGRAPLTAVQIDMLDRQASRRGFSILITPDRTPEIAAFEAVLAVKDRAGLTALAAASAFDIAPPTDRRPFFFNQLRLTDPLHVLKVLQDGGNAGVMGHVKATLNLYIILAFSTLMAVLVILVPLRRELAALPGGYVAAGTAWFFLIGLGFMLFEMALLQRMSIFLGHPSYSLGILLFSLILSTGVGSFLSERIELVRGTRKYIWAAAVAGVALAGMAAGDALFAVYAQADLIVRALLCVGVITPLGLLLGFGFPTGMAMVRQIDERPSAWFWGINGVAGVSGCALAIVLNIALGIDKTMVAGALCYLMLVVPGWALDRRMR